MLIPVKQLIPLRITPAATTTWFLEATMPVLPLLRPRIFFKNTSPGVTVNVEIQHILDLGVSDDPLISGTFPTEIVNSTINPDDLLVHYFMEVALSSAPVRHQISVENPSATETVIIQVWVEGWFEESLKDLPEFEPIFV